MGKVIVCFWSYWSIKLSITEHDLVVVLLSSSWVEYDGSFFEESVIDMADINPLVVVLLDFSTKSVLMGVNIWRIGCFIY